MRFSDRIGATKSNDVIQKDTMTRELRNLLWNVYDGYFGSLVDVRFNTLSLSGLYSFAQDAYVNYFKHTLDSLPYNTTDFHKEIRDNFFYKGWYEVYNFLEFTISCFDLIDRDKEKYTIALNFYLKQELSAYRVVGDKFVPITSDEEIQMINKSLSLSEEYKFYGVHNHISASLDMLANKDLKESNKYRNSIKESISAVEALCNQINGNKAKGLDGALSKLEKKVSIHKQLKQGFKNLYNYTSDSDEGIRHTIMDEPNLDVEDSVYMLVSCSAFINYLIQKAEKAGVFKKESDYEDSTIKKS